MHVVQSGLKELPTPNLVQFSSIQFRESGMYRAYFKVTYGLGSG